MQLLVVVYLPGTFEMATPLGSRLDRMDTREKETTDREK
jgi:hypothetical protein